ncbi:MAG: HEAT repeat domain-containing protein [Bacteroidota bacterium]
MSTSTFAQVSLLLLALLTSLTVGLALVTLVLHARRDRREALKQSRWERWEPVLLDMLVGDVSPRTLAGEVRKGERGDYFRLLQSYAFRLGGESRALLSEAAAPHLGTIGRWLRHRRPDRRAMAIHLFGFLGDRSDLDLIRPLLADESPAVAMIAARALARSSDPAYVYPVVNVLDRFESWGVQAVASLLTVFGVGCAPTLLQAVGDDRRTDLARCACIEALRLLGYPPAAHDAASWLAADPRPPREVSAALLRLLRDIGGPGHADVVRQLTESEDDVLRLHAITALAAVSLQPGDAARIELALSDPSRWVAIRAAQGLIDSGRVQSLRAVAFEESPRGSVARQVLEEAGLDMAL